MEDTKTKKRKRERRPPLGTAVSPETRKQIDQLRAEQQRTIAVIVERAIDMYWWHHRNSTQSN